MRRLALGVIGAGHMGSRHAAKVRALGAAGPVRLAAIHDVDAPRAGRLARALGVAPVPDCAALLRACDAVIVAVPVRAHHAVVARALAAGCDVLVEKPIAADLEEARDLIARAQRDGRVLQVGHLDWFNPATCTLRRRLRTPRRVVVERVGPFVDRAAEVDVVRDLMIHDIDILQRLLGAVPREVEATGERVRSRQVDVASARLAFDGGCVAELTASRVAARARRRMRFAAIDGCWNVDFLEATARFVPEGVVGTAAEPGVPAAVAPTEPDALLAQLRGFVSEVVRRDDPLGSARSAAAALATAHRVLDAMPAAGAAPETGDGLATVAGPAR